MLYDKPEPSSPPSERYAGPQLADEDPDFPIYVARRIAFALGMTLACYGIGTGLPGYNATPFLGWGGFLLGMTIPLGRRRHRD